MPSDAAPEGSSAQPRGFRRSAVERVGHNSVVQLASQLSVIAIGLALTPLIVGELGLAVYGIWTFVTVTIGYLTMVDPGLNAAVVRFGSPRYAAGDPVTPARLATLGMGIWLALGLLLSPLLLVVVPFIETHLKGSAAAGGQIGWLTVFAFASLIFTAASSVQNSMLVAAGEQWISNVIDASSRLVYAGLAVWLLLAGHGLAGLAVALGTQSVLAAVAAFAAIRVRVGPPLANPLRLERAQVAELARFGGWAQAGNLFQTLNGMTNSLVAGTFISASSVGVLSFGQRLARQIPYFSTIPQDTLLHATAARFGDGQDPDGLRRVAVDANRIVSLFSTLPGFGLVAVAPVLLAAWLGKAYAGAAAVTVILALNHVTLGMMRGARTTLIGVGYIRLNASAQALTLVANAAVTLALVGPLGIEGIALGSLAAAVVTTTYLQRRFHQILGLSLREGLLGWAWRLWLPGVVAAGCCLAATYALPEAVREQRGPAALALVALAVAYLALSALGLRATRGFSPADFATLRRGLPRPLARAFNSAPLRWVARVPAGPTP